MMAEVAQHQMFVPLNRAHVVERQVTPLQAQWVSHDTTPSGCLKRPIKQDGPTS